jgi:uncharacterized protein (UPF0335 family)
MILPPLDGGSYHNVSSNTSSLLLRQKAIRYKRAQMNQKKEENMTKIGNVAADQLKSYIERIEKLEEEKADISEHIRNVFAEAKGNGYDAKAMREILKLRKLESHEREEQEYMLDIYKRALGMAFAGEEEEAA